MQYLYINNDEKCKSVTQLNENGPWKCNISFEDFKKYHFKKNRKIQFICSECHTPTIGTYQYIKQFVCKSCIAKKREQLKDKKAISEKRKRTCLEIYNVENVSQLPETKQKVKKSYLEHYGVDHYSRSEESKKRRHEIAQEWKKTDKFKNEIWPKIRATWIAKYGYAIDDPDFISKLRLQSVEKYGVEYPMQSDECKKQVRQTCLEKYGVDSANKLESKKAQSRKTCIEKYGVPYYAQTEEAKIRWSESLVEHYGVTNPIFSFELNEKRLETLYNNYGVENPTYIRQPTLLMQSQPVKPDTEMLHYENGIYTHKCNECGKEFTSRLPHAGCNYCHPADIASIVTEIKSMFPGIVSGPTPEKVSVDLWYNKTQTGIIIVPAYYISFSMRNRFIANDNLFIPIKADEFYKYHPEGQLIVITDLEWTLYKKQIKNLLKSQLSSLYKEELYFEAITEETAKYIENQYYFPTMPKCSHYVGVFGNGDLLGVIGYNVSDSECRIYRFALKARYILDLHALSNYIQSNHMVSRIIAMTDYRFDNGSILFESNADFIKVTDHNKIYHNNKQLSFVPKKHFAEKIKSLLGIEYDNSMDAHDNADSRLYSFYDIGHLLFSIPVN